MEYNKNGADEESPPLFFNPKPLKNFQIIVKIMPKDFDRYMLSYLTIKFTGL